MGKIDTKSRLYLQQKEVFADAFNYYIYDGKPVIRPEELKERDISELSVPYGTDGAEIAVQRYRDVLKLAVLMEDGETAYLMLGLEAQDQVHYAIPVITLVLLFSPEKWDGPLSLHEMLAVQKEAVLSLVPDYKVHLITPHDLDEGNLDKFQSSLREVLQFIKYSQDKEKMKEIVAENERYREMDPKAVSLLNSCTKVEIKIEEEEEKVNMCKAWDDMAKECEEKGRREEHERMCKAWDDMAKECEEKGKLEGEERHVQLTKTLLAEKRYGDLEQSADDLEYRKELYREFGL